MIRVLILLLAASSVTACGSTRPVVDLSTPARTIESFHAAFAADDEEAEYKCFSDEVRGRLGHAIGYSIAREVLRAEHPLIVSVIGWSDLEGRLETEIAEDGVHAIATIEAGDGDPIEVDLVYQPAYLLVHADGEVTEGYATGLRSAMRGSEVLVVLRDPFLADETPRPIVRVDIRPRWVIQNVPGLEQALGRSASGGP